MRIKSLLVTLALISLACNALTQSSPLRSDPVPTASNLTTDPNCPDPQPSQDYIDQALQHQDQHFSSPGWKKSYTVMESRVSITWRNDEQSAIANFDHVIFCDVTDTRLDEYYNNDILAIIFQNYETHEITTECRAGDIRLIELDVTSRGVDYDARFWVELVDGDHTRETLLVFPNDDPVTMNSYSQQIMPALPSCK